jgi:stearoyl-CoA desaturase (delta-9 desaturase)
MTQAATNTLLKEEPAANFTVDDILWKKVFYFFYLHVSAFYGLYLLTTTASWKTTIWCTQRQLSSIYLPLLIFPAYFLLLCCVEGITVGTHRLWSHRAFKAKLPLRILLAFFQTLTFQKDVYDWVRDHRVHHKYADTNADPHNATRGFFFSHMGWMMIKKHKEVIEKGKALDMSDLEADPVVMIQRK